VNRTCVIFVVSNHSDRITNLIFYLFIAVSAQNSLSRLADQPSYHPNLPSHITKIRSNSSLRRESLDNRQRNSNYSNTGISTTPIWPHRLGLTASQSTDALLSSRYLYQNPLLLSSSNLFKDFLLGPDYGHGWLASGKLSRLGLFFDSIIH
jgi:hypothetical protein